MNLIGNIVIRRSPVTGVYSNGWGYFLAGDSN